MLRTIAVVGAGAAGKRHARIAAEETPGAEVHLISAREVLDRGRGGLARLKPDALVVAAPAPYHLEIASLIEDDHVHLLVEKPLTADLHQAELFLSRFGRNDSVEMVGYNLRFFESLNLFKSLLSQGEIGRILFVRCEVGQYLPTWRPGEDYRTGVSAREGLGGGVLLELSHEFDYLRWIFGDIAWLSGTTARTSSLDIDVEDTAMLVMQAGRDGPAEQVPITLNLDFVRHDRVRQCIAVGESGSLRWDGLRAEVAVHGADSRGWQTVGCFTDEGPLSYVRQWRGFVRAIEEGGPSPVPFDDGVAVLRIVNAARMAATTGDRIALSST